MPKNVLGPLFSSLSQKAHDRATEEREKQDKSRTEEIAVWKTVLENPASSEEQRNKAVENLNKLYNWKGKGDSPFQRLAGFMKHVGSAVQKKQAEAAVNTGAKPDTGMAPGERQEGPPNTGAPKPDTSDIGQGKQNVAKKILGKAASGLGTGLGVVADALNPHPKELPPLNAKDFPSGEQEEAHKLENEKKELDLKQKYILEQIKARGEEQVRAQRARVQNALASKVKIPGNAVIGAFPKDQQAGLVDENMLAIDPNGIYAPTEPGMGVEMVEGQPMLHAVRVGTGAARESDYGTWMIDTTKEPPQLVEVPTHRKSGPPSPPQTPTKTTGETKERPSTLPPLKPSKAKPQGAAGGAGTAKPAGGSDKFHRAPEGFIRSQQAIPYTKLATATDEARNSLIGDDPEKHVAGLYADLDIFKDRESIARIRNYLGFIEKNIGSTSVGQGAGFVNGLEWTVGIPQAVNELQQRGLQQFADRLKPAEQRFVSDYFRVMGTIGGMRASTGAPAAKWSFQTLFNELPTPGPVTDYADAQRRITNLIQETNVVAKRNPMSKKIDVNKLNQQEQEDQDDLDTLSPAARKILEDRNVIKRKKR